MKFSLHKRLCLSLLGALSLGFWTGVGATPSALSNISGVSASNLLVLFEPPTDEKVNNSRGGASRPTEVKCIQDDAYGIPLTALIPESGIGLTMAPRPTLLAYVPPTTATDAHLTLRDNAHIGLYQSAVNIPQTGGIIRITLPADSPELTVGETYSWSLALLCQPTQTDMPIVGGQIRRVAQSADMVTMEQQSLHYQAVIYGQAGVWHDMLAALATLRQATSDDGDLDANWVEVLQNENLDAIAHIPLLN